MNSIAHGAPFLPPAEIPLQSHPVSDADNHVVSLTTRLVTGDEEAWREFHAEYCMRLFHYLLVVCSGNEHLARECLQLALVKIVRHIRLWDQEDAFWSWLTVVVRSCVIDQTRRQTRYRVLLERYAGVFIEETTPPHVNPLPDLLENCMRTLSEDDRKLLTAKYYDGQSTAALSALAGCTEKAVESRLARLRDRIRTHLLHLLRNEI